MHSNGRDTHSPSSSRKEEILLQNSCRGFTKDEVKQLNEKAKTLKTNYCDGFKTDETKLTKVQEARCWQPEVPELVRCQEEQFPDKSLQEIRTTMCDQSTSKKAIQDIILVLTKSIE